MSPARRRQKVPRAKGGNVDREYRDENRSAMLSNLEQANENRSLFRYEQNIFSPRRKKKKLIKLREAKPTREFPVASRPGFSLDSGNPSDWARCSRDEILLCVERVSPFMYKKAAVQRLFFY